MTTAAALRFRRLSTATVLFVAAAAAVLSFSGLHALALSAGFPPELAWLFPILIDGLVVTGSWGVITATLSGVSAWYPWMLTLLGVTASVAGNVIVAPADLPSQLVHAAPPITFALAIEGLLRLYRASAVQAMLEQSAPPPRQAPRRATVAPATRPNPPEARPERDAARGAREAEAMDAPVPAALVPAGPPGPGTARQRLAALLESDASITGAEAARQLGLDPSHVRKVLRELRRNDGTTGSPELDAPPALDAPAAEASLAASVMPAPDQDGDRPRH